jgi:hypothetical protein
MKLQDPIVPSDKSTGEHPMQSAAFDAEVHHAFIDQLRRTGCAPSRHEVAAALARPVNKIEQALHRLSASHGVVLHPHVCEPWVIHPFSLSPTATWVQQDKQGWWAPCIWCGFGIAALVGGNAVIHARIGGEMEDVDINIVNDEVVENNLWVHFAVPPRAAGTTSTIFAPPFCPSGKRPMSKPGAADMVFLPDPLCRFPRFKSLGGNGTRITAIETGANGPLPRQ